MSSQDSDQEWMQFVEEVQLSSPAAAVGGGGGDNRSHVTSPDHPRLSPKGCISKPVRRKSRAPRRTPATLLTANATNFRALVQKFTGRPTAPFSSISHRGPLTLNFELGTQQYNIHHFGSDYRHRHRHRHQEEQQQQFFPAADSTSIITSDVLLSTVSDGRNSQGGFTMENIPLDELMSVESVNSFSAGLNTDDIGYFW